jgi:hypothetical protein
MPAPSQAPPLSVFTKSSVAVSLCGFPPGELEQASKLLSDRGHRVVRSLVAAQWVIAGPDADDSVWESTRARGLEVTAWDAVLETFRGDAVLAELAPAGEAPLATPTVLPLQRVENGVPLWLDQPLPVAETPESKDLRLVPAPERFAGLCMDQAFAETVLAVLSGVNHRMPVALEGETAASKTIAVLYLAHLIKQPVVRLNLNGQTDPGELVGRFVPDAAGWRFQEGALPVAMRRGHWLLLDEMNLAEPQVLERLNSALEIPPTLMLSEGHGTVFGPGGDVEVAAGFRMLATLNPAEYAGRSVLSPAFRNRWLIWHQAQLPDEAAILALLRTLALGEQPVIRWQGCSYQAAPVQPLHPWLQQLPDLDAVLARLAMFHTTVAKAAGGPGITPGLARQRRERDVFTRRNLLATLHLCAARAHDANPAVVRAALTDSIHRIYLNRYPDSADRRAIHAHLRAAELV